jgi:hypothetical protein
MLLHMLCTVCCLCHHLSSSLLQDSATACQTRALSNTATEAGQPFVGSNPGATHVRASTQSTPMIPVSPCLELQVATAVTIGHGVAAVRLLSPW